MRSQILSALVVGILGFGLLSNLSAANRSQGFLGSTHWQVPLSHLSRSGAAAGLSHSAATSMASADFDKDGVPDLVIAFSTAEGSRILLYPGNVKSIFPDRPEALQAFLDGRPGEPPFFPPEVIYEGDERPDFLVAGDFDADSIYDLVLGSRDGSQLRLLRGDGRGGILSSVTREFDGRITALQAGEVNYRDGLQDFAVTLDGSEGAQLLVFEWPEGAWRGDPERFPLPAPAREVVLGRMDDDRYGDLAVAAGSEVTIVRGRDRKLSFPESHRKQLEPAQVMSYPLTSPPVALAVGNFIGGALDEVAVRLANGTLELIEVGESGIRLIADYPLPGMGGALSPAEVGTEIIAGLWTARLSGSNLDDLLVSGGGTFLLSSGPSSPSTGPPGVLRLAEQSLREILPLRLNPDTVDDLVLLTTSQQAVLFQSQPENPITVNDPGDEGDGGGFDRVCDTGNTSDGLTGKCTLRAAIQQAKGLRDENNMPFNVMINVDSGKVPQITPSLALLVDGHQITLLGNGLIIDGTDTVGGVVNQDANGLILLKPDGSLIRGVTFRNFKGRGIHNIDSSNTTVEGCRFEDNTLGGILVEAIFREVSGTVIGGTTAEAGNHFVRNYGGIAWNEHTRGFQKGGTIQGNIVGMPGQGNTVYGIDLSAGIAGNKIGGTEPGAGNLIEDNGSYGIGAGGIVQGNIVRGNGKDPADFVFQGVGMRASGQVGGTTLAAANIVIGNGGFGIAGGGMIQGNFVGIDPGPVAIVQRAVSRGNDDASGHPTSPAQGNLGGGIVGIGGIIGGTVEGAGNTIAFNQGPGVEIGPGEPVLGNSIYSNDGPGIDIPNLARVPVLSPTLSLSEGVLSGTMTGYTDQLNRTFRIELFTNTECSPPESGEGETFLRNSVIQVTLDEPPPTEFTFPSKDFTYPVAADLAMNYTATATLLKADGTPESTSPFSACAAPLICPTIPPFSYLPFQAAPEGCPQPILVNSKGDRPDNVRDDGFCSTGKRVDGSGDNCVRLDGDCECTLRAAIWETNDEDNPDEIRFAPELLENGRAVIELDSILPDIVHPVNIDARSIDEEANACRPSVGITPNRSLALKTGLVLVSSDSTQGSTVSGLAVYDFDAELDLQEREGGIVLGGSGGHQLRCNFLGLDLNGKDNEQNSVGVQVLNGSNANRIGPLAEADLDKVAIDRNVISCNRLYGILDRAGSTVIQSNFIGTDPTGQEPRGNGRNGILIMEEASQTVIGGAVKLISGLPAFGDYRGNLISANGTEEDPEAPLCGVLVIGSGVLIHGNAIGTNPSGARALPNGIGVCVGFRMGGTSNGPRSFELGSRNLGNLISGNRGPGVIVSNGSATVQNNRIGTTRSGKVGRPNEGGGVLLFRETNVLVKSNTIAFNRGHGVQISEKALGEITENSIFDNDGEGISHLDMRFPILYTAVATSLGAVLPADSGSSRTLKIEGRAPSSFRVEFFSNLACDETQFGEGEKFLGKVQNLGGGGFVKEILVGEDDLLGEIITATYLNHDTITSGFSQCIPVARFAAEGGSLPTPHGSVFMFPSTGSQFQSASAAPAPNRSRVPDSVIFSLGLLSFRLNQSASSSASFLIIAGPETFTVTLQFEGARPDSYYNYGPTRDNLEPHYYRFLFDGATGAEIFDDQVILHFVDGQRGDHDLEVNSEIETRGGPVFLAESLYFPYNQTPAGSFVGIAVSNLGDEAGLLEFERFESDGSQPPELEPTIRADLESANQLAQLTTEILQVAPGFEQENWLQMRSSQARVGSFFQFGTLDLSQLDGSVAIRETSTELLFTRVFEGNTSYRGQPATTLVSIVNPGSRDVELTLTLHTAGNSTTAQGETTSVSRPLAGKAFIYESVSDIFGEDLQISEGFLEVEVTSGEGVIGFEVIQLINQPTVIGLNAVEPGTTQEAFSAQFASQSEAIFTNLNLINTADLPRQVTLTRVAEDGGTVGRPVMIEVGAGRQMSGDARDLFDSTESARLLPLGSQDFVGSLRVEADGLGVTGDVIFGDPAAFQFAAALPLQTETFTEAAFSQVANVPGFFTGLALFNPGLTAASVTIQVFAPDGSLVGESEQVLGAGERLSGLVPELVPIQRDRPAAIFWLGRRLL